MKHTQMAMYGRRHDREDLRKEALDHLATEGRSADPMDARLRQEALDMLQGKLAGDPAGAANPKPDATVEELLRRSAHMRPSELLALLMAQGGALG